MLVPEDVAEAVGAGRFGAGLFLAAMGFEVGGFFGGEDRCLGRPVRSFFRTT